MLDRAVERTWFRTTHHLAMGIYRMCCAAAAECAQVDHHAFTPEKSMMILAARQISVAHHLTGVIYPADPAVVASQSAQIRKDSVFPKKRMDDRVPGEKGSASYLTSVVHALSVVQYRAPKRPEIDHLAVLPKERVHGREPCVRIRYRVYKRLP